MLVSSVPSSDLSVISTPSSSPSTNSRYSSVGHQSHYFVSLEATTARPQHTGSFV